jgi:signal transduction histidine kinase
MFRKIFFLLVFLGLCLNAALDYRAVMETSFPAIFTKNSRIYHVLAVFDCFLLLTLAIMFWHQWLENRKIENRMSKSISDISALNQKLRAHQEYQSTRFKTAVHDIKNPLSVIKGFAELMKEDANDGASISEMSQIVERISGEAISLVQGLLTEPDSGKVENINMVKKVERVCSELRPVARKKNQNIVFDKTTSELFVSAVAHDVESVLHNLIGNALKFSPQGGSVEVSASHLNEKVAIVIKDDGPGFSEEDRKNIFHEGKALSARPTGDELSSGVGLVAVKNILDSYGAKIYVASSHLGAQVTVHFPLVQSIK